VPELPLVAESQSWFPSTEGAMREDLREVDAWRGTVTAFAKFAGSSDVMGSDRMGPGSKFNWKGRRSESRRNDKMMDCRSRA
jgi:hypothetical protein